MRAPTPAPAGQTGLMPDAAPQEVSDAPEQSASPEEQAQYERFVANGIMVIYGEETMPGLVEQMKQIPDPKQALATVAYAVFTRVLSAAEDSGEKPAGDVLINAGQEIFEHCANLATKAGIHDFEKDTEAFDGAWYLALDKVRVDGTFDPQEVAQDFEAIVQADKAGQLNALVGADIQKGQPMPKVQADG